MNYKVVH